MNLAETASIFFETALGDAALDQAATARERFEHGWYEAESAASFLLNIPARFDFECALHEAKATGRMLSPADLEAMTVSAWQGRYGDALTTMDSMFWASKQHFHLVSPQFYNFPYTFGYLFALGVYALRAEAPSLEAYHKQYTALLRDTGRMTAEDLVHTHLGQSIEDPAFWRKSISVVAAKIDAFEEAINELGL